MMKLKKKINLKKYIEEKIVTRVMELRLLRKRHTQKHKEANFSIIKNLKDKTNSNYDQTSYKNKMNENN